MKDFEYIDIVLPLHKFDDTVMEYLTKALNSVQTCQENFRYGTLRVLVIDTPSIHDDVDKFVKTNYKKNVTVKTNDGEKTDFCSQVNFGVSFVDSKYMSILEYDDTYNPKWFKMFNDYYFTNENVSLFLPITVITTPDDNDHHFVNEIAWSGTFSDEIGYIDFNSLKDYTVFNITGGIFNVEDFKKVGQLKPSMKMASAYEFLLRLTSKECKVFVVPKEGYTHIMNREGSLTEEYSKEMTIEEIRKYFVLAELEYVHTEDRGTTIENINKEESLT